MSDKQVSVRLTQQQDYRFLIDFGAPVPTLLGDEPPPLGNSAGPSPVQLLAAAVGNCLSGSLLFALRKFKQKPESLHTMVEARVGRNDQNRMRVLSIEARITVGVPAANLEHIERAVAQFEEFCTVTQSVRQGIPVEVSVYDSAGARLK